MKMAEVTARERDLELELDLGLSIGVSFRRLKEEKTISISKEDDCCTDNESLAMDSKQRKRGRSFGPESEEERKRELKKEKYGVMKNNHRKNLHTMPLVNGYWTNCTEEKIVNQNVSSLNGGNLEQSCCSSLVSDNYQTSSSNEGGSSNSYTKSNSSSDQYQMMSSHVSRISPTRNLGIKEELAISSKHEVPLIKSISNTVKSNPMKPKNIKMENGKPPKPQTQACHIPSLRQMPRVSTTGTGRNGKTIVGILYRYSKAEVSILCACHGESFSPAEFVKHAGGVEVLHPLRHITVLPTDSGIPSTFR